jgi:hypothetical protein
VHPCTSSAPRCLSTPPRRRTDRTELACRFAMTILLPLTTSRTSPTLAISCSCSPSASLGPASSARPRKRCSSVSLCRQNPAPATHLHAADSRPPTGGNPRAAARCHSWTLASSTHPGRASGAR